MTRITILILLAGILNSCTYYLGPNRWAKSFPESPVVIPQNTDKSVYDYSSYQVIEESDLRQMADKQLKSYSTKYSDTTINPRTIIAKLLLKQDVEEVNQTIMEFEAWGTTGTSHKLNKIGDYDFREILFTHIVWLFKNRPDLLYPNTARHIIDKLIIDNGSKPTLKAPKVMGLIRETENHILMKETSRYLKNQWLFELYPTAEYDNELNGMRDFLVHHLEEMVQTGFFEFNANPYISFTMEALHVLHTHAADPTIKALSKKVMDAENWQYALGTFQMKKYGPFRRRMERASETSIYSDRHGVLIRIELAKTQQESISAQDVYCCLDKALIIGTSDYLLPVQTKAMIMEKPDAYYAKIGHGLKAPPEIYYGTKDYLLSAGGIRFGKRSQITPRPLTLFLNDDASDISECFHIPGKGKLNQWNNTGVYHQLMVGNQAVHAPLQYPIYKQLNDWIIYKPYENKDIFVSTYSKKNLGILYVGNSYEDILALNQNESTLRKTFYLSAEEKIEYNVNSKRKWVITATPQGPTTRKVKKWPRFDVDFKPTTR